MSVVTSGEAERERVPPQQNRKLNGAPPGAQAQGAVGRDPGLAPSGVPVRCGGRPRHPAVHGTPADSHARTNPGSERRRVERAENAAGPGGKVAAHGRRGDPARTRLSATTTSADTCGLDVQIRVQSDTRKSSEHTRYPFFGLALPILKTKTEENQKKQKQKREAD